jgi:CRISPR-associated protein Csm1
MDFLILAALIHDIGKLLERGQIFPEVREDVYYLSVCPEHNGSYEHLHCAYTRKFCEVLEKQFDFLRKAQDKSWKIWAAAHHLDNGFCLEARVIRLADMLSSSEGDNSDFFHADLSRKTFLEPIIERVCLGKNTGMLPRHRYPLKRLLPEENSLFPVGQHLAEKYGTGEYKQLAQEFLDEVAQLAQKRSDLPLPYLIVSLSSLLEIYTANVPSDTNVCYSDISLFDHLRTTAAIAQGLYLYQLQDDNPLNGLKDDHKKNIKLILVCGEFSGIQDFISNLSNKGTIRALCGRSFFVQYFCRISVDFLLARLGLSRVAMLYNSGGKFYILIPANLKNKLFELRKQINKWLLEEFGGDIFLGLGLAELTTEMLEQGEMHKTWQLCASSLENDCQAKFKEQFESDFFAPQTNFNPVKSCPICGNRFIQDGEKYCKLCIQLKNLTQQLQKAKALLIVWGEREKVEEILDSEPVLEFSGPGVGLFILDQGKLKNAARLKHFVAAECVFMDQLGQGRLTDYPLPCAAISCMYPGQWKLRRWSWIWNGYSRQNANSINKVGFLRMDMDNTQLMFFKGLCLSRREENKLRKKTFSDSDKIWCKKTTLQQKSMVSISRMATLSRQLNFFFSSYVVRLMDQDEFDKCQFVYAGGDDLFIVGSLDQLVPLARTINDKFKRFSCYNPDLSISGGVIPAQAGYPIYKAAQIAAQAEKKAKTWRRVWKNYLEKKGKAPLDIEKGSFCLLDTPILWEDFYLAEKIKKLLEEEIRANKAKLWKLDSTAQGKELSCSLTREEIEKQEFALSNGRLLSCLLDMVETNKLKVHHLIQHKRMSLADAWTSLEYDQWRWRFTYQLKRVCKQYKEDKIAQWSEIILGNDRDRAYLPVYVWLEMPVNWVKFSLAG